MNKFEVIEDIYKFIEVTNKEYDLNYLKRRFGISNIDVEDGILKNIVTVSLSRPGLLIGKGGSYIDSLNVYLTNKYQKPIEVHVKEDKTSDLYCLFNSDIFIIRFEERGIRFLDENRNTVKNFELFKVFRDYKKTDSKSFFIHETENCLTLFANSFDEFKQNLNEFKRKFLLEIL